MCFFTLNQNNNGSVGFGILVFKLAIVIGLFVAIVFASLNSTEESSFILRILKPVIVDGKKAIYKLLTDPNFWKPFMIASGIATILVLATFGMTTLRNYIGPQRQTNRLVDRATPTAELINSSGFGGAGDANRVGRNMSTPNFESQHLLDYPRNVVQVSRGQFIHGGSPHGQFQNAEVPHGQVRTQVQNSPFSQYKNIEMC